MRQLPEIHGVQCPGLSELQAAEAGGIRSTRRPHCPLPTSSRWVIACQMHIFNKQVGSLNNMDIRVKDFPLCHCVYCGVLKQLLTSCWFFSGVSNEARFVFTVQSIVMPQKLKGTLTFIVKVSKEKEKHNILFYNIYPFFYGFVRVIIPTLFMYTL